MDKSKQRPFFRRSALSDKFRGGKCGVYDGFKMKTASCFGAIEGKSNLKHKRFVVSKEVTASTTETPVISLLTSRFNFAEENINRRRIFVDELSITNESANKAALVNVYLGEMDNLQNFCWNMSTNLNSIVLTDLEQMVL